jgi:hypothetical protein
VANLYDLSLPAGIEDEQRRKMAALLDGAQRPTQAERDLILRGWVERLGTLAGAAVEGIADAEVYVPLALLEVPEDAVVTPEQVEAAKAAASAAVASIEPSADDLHVVAVQVLGDELATRLGL